MNVVGQALAEARSLIADLATDYSLASNAMTHACCEVVIARIDVALDEVRGNA